MSHSCHHRRRFSWVLRLARAVFGLALMLSVGQSHAAEADATGMVEEIDRRHVADGAEVVLERVTDEVLGSGRKASYDRYIYVTAAGTRWVFHRDLRNHEGFRMREIGPLEYSVKRVTLFFYDFYDAIVVTLEIDAAAPRVHEDRFVGVFRYSFGCAGLEGVDEMIVLHPSMWAEGTVKLRRDARGRWCYVGVPYAEEPQLPGLPYPNDFCSYLFQHATRRLPLPPLGDSPYLPPIRTRAPSASTLAYSGSVLHLWMPTHPRPTAPPHAHTELAPITIAQLQVFSLNYGFWPAPRPTAPPRPISTAYYASLPYPPECIPGRSSTGQTPAWWEAFQMPLLRASKEIGFSYLNSLFHSTHVHSKMDNLRGVYTFDQPDDFPGWTPPPPKKLGALLPWLPENALAR